MSFSQLDQEREAYNAKLTSPEKAAVVRYTGSAYKSINSDLRFGKKAPGTFEKRLDAAIAKSPATEDLLVYRGVSSGPWISDLEVGDGFEDKGYGSTSVSKGVAQSFGGDILMEIEVPKGTPIAPVTGQHDHEKEMLLGRNTRYEIVRVDHSGPYGAKVMRVRVVPPTAVAKAS